ncbi:hypothetical protein AVEN_41988-1, partial [Araneus ventricosus]
HLLFEFSNTEKDEHDFEEVGDDKAAGFGGRSFVFTEDSGIHRQVEYATDCVVFGSYVETKDLGLRSWLWKQQSCRIWSSSVPESNWLNLQY